MGDGGMLVGCVGGCVHGYPRGSIGGRERFGARMRACLDRKRRECAYGA